MAYQSTIIRCYKDFEGLAWVQYDRAFRRQAAVSKNLDWSQVNTTLYSLCFAGRAKRSSICAHCLSDNHTSESCLEAPASTPARRTSLRTPTSRSASSKICRLFNAKDGPRCYYKACRYAHACSKCRGAHPVSACTSERASATSQAPERSHQLTSIQRRPS